VYKQKDTPLLNPLPQGARMLKKCSPPLRGGPACPVGRDEGEGDLMSHYKCQIFMPVFGIINL